MPTISFLDIAAANDECAIILANMLSGCTLGLYIDTVFEQFIKDWEVVYNHYNYDRDPMTAYETLMLFHAGEPDPEVKDKLSMSYPKPNTGDHIPYSGEAWVVKRRSDLKWFCDDLDGITSAETPKHSVMHDLEPPISCFQWEERILNQDGGALATPVKTSLAWLTDADAFDEQMIFETAPSPADYMRDKLGLYAYEANEYLVILKIPKTLFEAQDDVYRPTFFSANGYPRFKSLSLDDKLATPRSFGTTADLDKFEKGDHNIEGVPEVVCDNITYGPNPRRSGETVELARLGQTTLSRKSPDGHRRFRERLKKYEKPHKHSQNILSKEIYKRL